MDENFNERAREQNTEYLESGYTEEESGDYNFDERAHEPREQLEYNLEAQGQHGQDDMWSGIGWCGARSSSDYVQAVRKGMQNRQHANSNNNQVLSSRSVNHEDEVHHQSQRRNNRCPRKKRGVMFDSVTVRECKPLLGA